MEQVAKSAVVAKWARYGNWLSLLAGLIVLVFIAEVAIDQEALKRFLAGNVAVPFPTPNKQTLFFAVIAAATPVGLLLYGLWTSSQFFRLIEAGHFFDAKCQGTLIQLARIAFAWSLANALTRSVLTLILTWSNPPGERVFSIGISFADFTSLILAILFLLFSHLQNQMVEVSEDSESFV
jgi:hypothetical protein